MFYFHLKLFFKNIAFVIFISVFSLVFLSVSIYFLYLKITLQLSDGLKILSLIILMFPNLLIYLGWIFYWNIFNKNIILNNQYYIFNLTNRNSVKFELKLSLLYYLIVLPYTLIFVIIELIIYSSVENFSYSFIYYFVFYWVFIFLILKFVLFLSKIRKNALNGFSISFFCIVVNIITYCSISFFIYYLDSLSDLTKNTWVILFYCFLIINPNLYSIIFLNNSYDSISISAIVIASIIILLVLFIVVLKDWLNEKKLIKLNDGSKPIISLIAKNISYSKNKKVLNNINFSIYENERISLLGNNGSGKTTFIKVITRSLLNKKVKLFWKYPDFLIAGVFQEFSFDDNFKCHEIIKYYSHLYNHHFTNEEISRLFKDFDLEKYYNYSYKSLSYGTKQKIKIIFALMNKPDLLILDEPFLGIDLKWKKLFLKKLDEFFKNKPNTALIFVSHNLNDHKFLTNKYFLINNGVMEKVNSIEYYLNVNKKNNKTVRI